jgi:hypothetical protein
MTVIRLACLPVFEHHGVAAHREAIMRPSPAGRE